MNSYKPPQAFNTEMRLLIPTVTKVNGVVKKTYPEPTEGSQIYGSFRTFGGTEINNNNLYTIRITAIVDTYYRPDITSDCRIAVNNNGTYDVYDVISDPENINMHNQFLQFKIERVKGGA